MLLANYNSDSGSESESESPAGPSRTAAPPPPRPSQPSLPASRPAVASGAAKPKRKGPVKITLDLPKDGKDSKANGAGGSDEERDEPEAKKPKLGLKGKGTSALLGMLPPPKRKTPGSTGVGGKPGLGTGLAVNKSMARPRVVPPPPVGEADLSGIIGAGAVNHGDADEDEEEDARGGMLLPASVARGKAKAKAEPAMDLFGLSAPSAPTTSVPSTSTPKPPQVSSAPAAPDFVPLAPTPQNPYPGYYQTPSGDWKAYDPAYYASFFSSETSELQGEKADDGRVGHHWDEYDTKGAHVQDVDVSSSLKAAREEEDRKNLMKKPKMPTDEFEYKVRFARMTQRPSLRNLESTVAYIGEDADARPSDRRKDSQRNGTSLHRCYIQRIQAARSQLEERIAQNKKNMRLAGQKYGF